MSSSRSVRPTSDSLCVVGAGLPRTGTRSLSIALELLLGGTCYHMMTLLERGGVDVPAFLAASRGGSADWTSVFRNYRSAVDWPASAFWRDIAAANPSSLIVLSQRDSADSWWRSVDTTVFENNRKCPPLLDDPALDHARYELTHQLLTSTFGDDWDDAETAKAGYERWNDEVLASALPERLIVWQPCDGWGPLCDGLDVPIPDVPFPHVNSADEFVQRSGLDR